MLASATPIVLPVVVVVPGTEQLPFNAGHTIDTHKFLVFNNASTRLNSLKFPFIVVPQLKRDHTDADVKEYKDNLSEFNWVIVDAFATIQQGYNPNPNPMTWSTFKVKGNNYRAAIRWVITQVYYEQNGLLGAEYQANISNPLYREIEVIVKSIEAARSLAMSKGIVKSRPGKLELKPLQF